jgi:hypothetical protein
MSTYYLLVCRECQERCHAASSGKGDNPDRPYSLIDSYETLPRFLMFHVNCKPLECIVESHDDADSPAFLDWTRENAEDLEMREKPSYARDRRARPWAYDPAIPRPGNGQPWVSDSRVHFCETTRPGAPAACGRAIGDPGFGGMLTTQKREAVTCPACLEKLAAA